MALTGKQQRFVAEYLVDTNATQAALRTGYSKKTAKQQGSRLLTNADIQAAVATGQRKVAEQLELDATTVLRELLMFARADIRKAYDKSGRLLPIHEMPEEVARAIAGVKVFEEFEGTGADRVKVGEVREVKFWDKVKGLELLGRHLKLFTDKVEHELGPNLEALLTESLGDTK